MNIVKVEICHLPMEYEFTIPDDTPLRELIQYFLDKGQMKKEVEYGIYNNFDQELYQGKDLEKKISEICLNQNKVDLKILKREEFGKYDVIQPPSDFFEEIQTIILELKINQQFILFRVEIDQKLSEFILQLKQDQQYKLTNQTYGFYYPTRQILYKEELLEQTFKNIMGQDSSQNQIELILVGNEEFQTGNTIKLKIKMIDEPSPLEFILEINKKATFVDLVEQLYSYFKLKREDVTFQLLMGNEYLLGIGEKKLQRPLEDLSIQDYAEIKVKKNWLKQNKQTKFIKIKVKIVDGNNSQNLTIEIDQNDTLGQFIEKLYEHLGHQYETVEFELFMGGNKIQIGQKALKSLYDLSIFDNTEIEVKRQWKGGADKKQVEISYK